MQITDDEIARYKAAAAAAGLSTPEDRVAGIVALNEELLSLASLLRSMDLTAADEPATIYSFPPILRSAQG